MFLLFEEAGKFMAGKVLSETDSSSTVELDTGKRVKVKGSNSLLRFDHTSATELLNNAKVLMEDIELELAWEFSPETEFSFADLAKEYFCNEVNQTPSLLQQVATLFRLYEAPHYFRRAGKGYFRKAQADALSQALLSIEKKKQVQIQIDDWTKELIQGDCPSSIREKLYTVLFKPDKNTSEYKAVVAASRATQIGAIQLLANSGAIDSSYDFHWRRFLLENFPRGTAFSKLQQPIATKELPLAEGHAFSIDDSDTTEIDDALSIKGLGGPEITLGIHIAAPGLTIFPGSPIDNLCRERMSTVYMPGHKIMMLPKEVIQQYTLIKGEPRPAVSLYLTFNSSTLEIIKTETLLERIFISENFRHDQLENTITESWLEEELVTSVDDSLSLSNERTKLSFLYRLAKHLKGLREIARGKPEVFNRPDYTFKLMNQIYEEPRGDETIKIVTRARGTPLDMIVSECMILANSTWGTWLAEFGVPAIYRSQVSLMPGVKVRMGTKPLKHAGIGVPCYTWSTSPLRRYTDLVNQWQIIACVQHGNTAALAAPFKPKDSELLCIISEFETTYLAYKSFQNTIEKLWTLKFLQQENISELIGTTLQEDMVRADDLPLVITVMNTENLPKGSKVLIKIGRIEEILLIAEGHILQNLGFDKLIDSAKKNSNHDENILIGSLEIGLDVNDPDPSVVTIDS